MKKDMIMNEMMAVMGNNHYIIITLQYARISSIDLLFGVIPYMMTMKEISQLILWDLYKNATLPLGHAGKYSVLATRQRNPLKRLLQKHL